LLKGYWNFIQEVTRELPESIFTLMSHHLKTCQEKNATSLDKALALRDAKLSFGCVFAKVMATIKSGFERVADPERPFSSATVQTYEAMSDVCQMYMDIIEGAISRMNTCLNKGYVRWQEAVPLKEKPSKKNKKNKRRKPAGAKAKKNVQQASLPAVPKNDIVINEEEPIFNSNPVNHQPAAEMPPLLSSMRHNLRLLRQKAGSDMQKQAPFLANIQNLKHIVRQLEGRPAKKSFAINTIFGETDLLRRLMETVLETSIILSPTTDKSGLPLFHQTQYFAHELHKYVSLILRDDACPQNIYLTVSKHRLVPYKFSQANACVNYFHSTKERADLPAQAKHLMKYLSLVETEENSLAPDENKRQKLLELHDAHMEQGLAFAAELVQAMADPNYTPEDIDPENIVTIEKELKEFFLIDEAVENQEEVLVLDSDIILQEQLQKSADIPLIANRSEALHVIDYALARLSIKSLHAPEGHVELEKRFQDRNTAFKNVRLYLTWLREKLQFGNYFDLYDNCVEEMKLLRRAHKELAIGLLLQGSYLINNQHVVYAKSLRRHNDPCYLNQQLLHWSPNSQLLPNLNEDRYHWMKAAHQWLCYPAPKVAMPEGQPWVDKIRHVVQTVKDLCAQHKTAVKQVKNDEENSSSTLATVERNIQRYIETEEQRSIFTSLAALAYLIKNA
jgi:hypothetical protein